MSKITTKLRNHELICAVCEIRHFLLKCTFCDDVELTKVVKMSKFRAVCRALQPISARLRTQHRVLSPHTQRVGITFCFLWGFSYLKWAFLIFRVKHAHPHEHWCFSSYPQPAQGFVSAKVHPPTQPQSKRLAIPKLWPRLRNKLINSGTSYRALTRQGFNSPIFK